MRLTVEIPDDDENLYTLAYPDVAALGFTSAEHIEKFMAEGGGTAGHWFVYLGAMSANLVRAVEPLPIDA
jgi:hypothetical protein